MSGRWRGPRPEVLPEGVVHVTRAEAATLMGVDQRVVTRYAANGTLKKYLTREDQFGLVVFSLDQVTEVIEQRRKRAAVLAGGKEEQPTPAPAAAPSRRW